MRLAITAFTIAAVCGMTLRPGVATAQPVARQLVADADFVRVLYTEQSESSAVSGVASMHRLGDLDADGVDEILLTHAARPFTGGNEDCFRASLVSPRTDSVLMILPSDETKTRPTVHTAAVMIDDINSDGVRDLAAARLLSLGVGLRVHSGATGEVLRAPFEDNIRFPWGLSLLPWEDVDGDGQADLIASNRGNSQSPWAFIAWSPGSGATALFTPVEYPPNGGANQAGRAMLDLGIGATGAREFLSSLTNLNGGTGIHFFGGDPVSFRAGLVTEQSPTNFLRDGAVRLGDLNGDGHREIVVAGRLPHPDKTEVVGIPVLSGAMSTPQHTLINPLSVHAPRIVVDIEGTATIIDPFANDTVIPVGDATGDAFPDYAFVGAMVRHQGPDEHQSEFIVGVCGRTGRAFFGAYHESTLNDPVQAGVIHLQLQPVRARDSILSPGDLNNDGAPDILVLVVRQDYGDGSEAPVHEQLLLTHYLPTPCTGDTDFDRAVNFTDLNAVLSDFGAQDITSPADLNASGVVDFTDLNLVLSSFGSTCD